jgi:hypothetical protein
MIICALNQNMLALHFSKILATDDDNKGLNCFHPAFHGKHALVMSATQIVVYVLKGHDFSRAAKAHRMIWALDGMRRLVSRSS